MKHTIINQKCFNDSNIYYKQLVNNLNTAIIIYTMNADVIYANKKAKQILKFIKHEDKYKPAWIFIHENFTEIKNNNYLIDIVLKTGKTLTNYIIGIKNNDTDNIMWFSTNIEPIFKDIKICNFIVNFYDISDTIYIKKQLTEYEFYLNSLKIITNTISKIADIDQTINNIIKNIFNIFKVDCAWMLYPCDLNAKYFEILYMATDPKYSKTKFQKKYIINEEIRQIYNKNLFLKDICTESINNDIFKNIYIIKNYNIRSQMTIALFPNLDMPWLLGIHQCSFNRNWKDVEKKLFKEIASKLTLILNQLIIHSKLENSEYRFQQIINQTNDSIIIHNFDGKILDANNYTCKNLGYTYNELLHLTIFNIETSISKSNIKKLWDDLKIKKHINLNGLQQRKDKSTFIVEIDMFYLDMINNEQIMIISKDITKFKKIKQEKIELERAMFHTQKLESLGVLAGGIAHDFNNLLAIIQGNIELAMIKSDTASPIQNNLSKIELAAKKASYLINQMLAYSGKGPFSIETIHINTLINEMLHLLKSSISKKAILKVDFAKNLGTFNGDSTQIRQIIMNLIINASDALENNNGLIKITTKEVDYKIGKNDYEMFNSSTLLSGKYIYIEVFDSGCGMSEETKNKLFEPFYTTKKNGRGLGMSAILGIIKAHKGAINIYSELNQGTVIKIIFPKNNFNPLLKQDHEIAKREDWKNSGFILLADDEKDVAEIAKDYLTILGFDIVITYNGKEALTEYEKHYKKYKYVILDLNMPELDGIQTFLKMKEINPKIKAFIHSGYSEKYIAKQYNRYGLSGFIQKPYTIQNLIKLLKE